MNGAEIAHEQRTSTWQNDPLRAPALLEGDQIMYDEPGRIIYRTEEKVAGQGTDYRSHWYRMVKPRFGPWTLLVRHGGGDQRVELGYDYNNYPAIMDPLTSDARYLLMNQLMKTYQVAHDSGGRDAAHKYNLAFVQGRLKKRVLPAQGRTKVWIQDREGCIGATYYIDTNG